MIHSFVRNPRSTTSYLRIFGRPLNMVFRVCVCVCVGAYSGACVIDARNRCWRRNVYTSTRLPVWNWTWSGWSTDWARLEHISWCQECPWCGPLTVTRRRRPVTTETTSNNNSSIIIIITAVAVYRRMWSGRWSGATIPPTSWTGTWWKRSVRTSTHCLSASSWSTRPSWRTCASSAVRWSSICCPLTCWKPVTFCSLLLLSVFSCQLSFVYNILT